MKDPFMSSDEVNESFTTSRPPGHAPRSVQRTSEQDFSGACEVSVKN
jgi:hypothetical protein